MTGKYIRFFAFSVAFTLHAALLFFKPFSVENVRSRNPGKLRVSMQSFSQPSETPENNLKPAPPPEKKKVARPVRKRKSRRVDKTVPQETDETTKPQPVETEGLGEPEQPSTSASSGSSDMLNYPGIVRAQIERNKFYPRPSMRMNHQGTAVVVLGIAPNGMITSAVIRSSSGYRALDNAAMDAVKKSAPLPPPTRYGLGQITLTVPIDFSIY